MNETLTRILAMFVLSFVATFLLIGFYWLFRRRNLQKYQYSDDVEETTAEDLYTPEPFRWYQLLFIIFGVLFALWLLPILAGALLAMCIIMAVLQYFRLRRALARCLRTRGTRLPELFRACSHPA